MTDTVIQEVRDVLEHADQYKWSIQGLGMMRTTLDDGRRVQVWDMAYALDDSNIHDHPWGFESQIIVGELTNRIYEEDRNSQYSGSFPMNAVELITGDGTFVSEPRRTELRLLETNTYGPGTQYTMEADQIHTTSAITGTVTIIKKIPLPEPKTTATVFWRRDAEWQTAKPRPATKAERDAFIESALSLFPKG